MDKIQLTNNIQANVTILSNDFIDHHMLKADGEFVKIFLLLMRLMNQGSYTGVDQIADMLQLTQKDVVRALNYWTKEGLLSQASPEAGKEETSEASREPKSENPERDVTESPGISVTVTARQVPSKNNVSPRELKSSIEGTDLEQTIYMAETYIGRPLSQAELSTFHYIDKQLHFTADLLEYLVEYCVTKGKKSIRYMESVAINWYQQNIDTVKKAREASASYTQNVFPVMKAFGISGRNPAPSELEFIKKWNTYGFDTSILVEACNRTILATNQPSFPYADRILTEWKNKGVRTMDHIQSLDKTYKASKTQTTPAPQKASNNAFHNFEQRTYDYDDLEARLLNNQKRPRG